MEDDRVLLPMRTMLTGRLRDVRKVGIGFSHETALLDLEFNRIQLPGQPEQDLTGRVVKLDDARETVDAEGRIRGIRATDTFGNTLSGLAISAASLDPMALGFAFASSLSVFRVPDSSILLPAGTELKFKIGQDLPLPAAPVTLTEQYPPLNPLPSASEEWLQLVQPLPFRTATAGTGIPSDLTSLLYVGSREAVEKAFLAAGWEKTDELDSSSTYGVMRSIVENQGYRAAPMSVLLLNGQKPAFTFAKTLNTFFSRHHLRVYETSAVFQGRPVWTSTATYDSGIGFSKSGKTFIHLINENIDEERSKVVNDLVLTGCVQGSGYVNRAWIPTDAKNATGDSLRTDGRIAVLDLNACEAPEQARVAATHLPAVREKLPAPLRPLQTAVLVVRNDFTRGNMPYQVYSGIRMASKSLRKKEHDINTPRSFRYGGQEFQIVDGAKPVKMEGVPDDPGLHIDREKDKRAPVSYASQLMFSLSGGLSGYGNPRFTTLPAELLIPVPDLNGTVVDPFPIESKLERGWNISARMTLNSWRYISNEFAYSRTATSFRLDGRDALADVPLNLQSDTTIQQFSYNTLFHLRPKGKRFRPYVAVGPAFQLIHLTESQPQSNQLLRFAARDVALFVTAYNFGTKPPLEGGGIFQVGLNYGGGATFNVTRRFFLRADYRETLSPQPDFWSDSPKRLQESLQEEGMGFNYGPLVKHGPLRHQLVTIGFGVSF